MLGQDINLDLSNWEGIELMLYGIILGYYVLISFYFIFLKYRNSKKTYWLFFGNIFISLAIGRYFFQMLYFFVPAQGVSPETGEALMYCYRLATFFTWIGISFAVGVLGILLLPTIVDKNREITEKNQIKKAIIKFLNNDKRRLAIRIILMIIPVIVGILALILPDNLLMDVETNVTYFYPPIELITIFGYPIGRLWLNWILLPLLVFLIPFMFLLLAYKTFGVLRKSYLLNGVAFLMYFAGRILDGVFNSLNWPHIKSYIPPLFIIVSLILFVLANSVSELK
ncbi:MAG: hypothetical protein ACFFBP_12020 [Promethearchaeota archaeon]